MITIKKNITPSKLWRKIMFDKQRPVFSPDDIIWDIHKHDISVGTYKTHFITSNRAILLDNGKIYLLYFSHRQLHGYQLLDNIFGVD